MSGFMDYIFGKQERTDQLPRFNEQQSASLDQILGRSTAALPQGFDFLEQLIGQSPEALQQFQAPAMRQFNEDIIPSIAERFTGMGAQNSSGFTQALGKAGAGLAENLSAQKAGLSMQGLQQLMQLLQTGMTPQTENVIRPGTQGLLQSLLSNAAGGFGSVAGGAFGRKVFSRT